MMVSKSPRSGNFGQKSNSAISARFDTHEIENVIFFQQRVVVDDDQGELEKLKKLVLKLILKFVVHSNFINEINDSQYNLMQINEQIGL